MEQDGASNDHDRIKRATFQDFVENRVILYLSELKSLRTGFPSLKIKTKFGTLNQQSTENIID